MISALLLLLISQYGTDISGTYINKDRACLKQVTENNGIEELRKFRNGYCLEETLVEQTITIISDPNGQASVQMNFMGPTGRMCELRGSGGFLNTMIGS